MTQSKPGKTRRPDRDESLVEVFFTIDPAAEEAVTQLILDIGASPAFLTRPDQPTARASFYLDGALTEEPARRGAIHRLRKGLRRIRNAGLLDRTPEIDLVRVRRENWAESWKIHFKPISIRGKLLVLPDWIRRKPSPGQRVVVLNPGLSFGTGQHPTTRFCLEQLVDRAGRCPGSFLDIGTGSGILAIAAAKLDFQPIVAFDADPDCVRVARQNARVNGVTSAIAIRSGDVGRMRGKPRVTYGTICANLTADLLLQHKERIVSALSSGGCLILAGILSAQFPPVRDAFEQLGLRLVRYRTVNEWRSGTFQSPA